MNAAVKRRWKHWFLRNLCWPLGPGRDTWPRMLGFHSVGEGSPSIGLPTERFRRQIDWLLENGFRIMTLRQWWQERLHRGAAPERSVVLTFDDGFESVFRNAFPILKERGLSATMFLVTDYIGKKELSERPFGALALPFLDWGQIHQMKDQGWDFQSHGRRHRVMIGLPPDLLQEELVGSKAILERELGEPVDFFCYPFGQFDAQAVEGVIQAGYRAAVTCLAGSLPRGRQGDWYQLPRTMADDLRTEQDFVFRFSPAYRRVSALWCWWKA